MEEEKFVMIPGDIDDIVTEELPVVHTETFSIYDTEKE